MTSEVRLSDNFSAAPGTYKLILRPAAVREIFNFIEWDVGWRSDPRVEQGGILLRCMMGYECVIDTYPDSAFVTKAMRTHNHALKQLFSLPNQKLTVPQMTQT